MKKYNAKLIHDFVEANKIRIKTIYLGMKEDWTWTKKLLYDADNGGYQLDLGDGDVTVAGITGSFWATPVMAVRFTDGKVGVISCYSDDAEEVSEIEKARGQAFALETGGMDDVSETLNMMTVVRCRDCKHSYEDIGGLCCSYGPMVDSAVPKTFFCTLGERKTP